MSSYSFSCLASVCWYKKMSSTTRYFYFPPTDGKSPVMPMTAATSSNDLRDMDCSPAEIEEFMKEVRQHLTLNISTHLFFYHLSALVSLFLPSVSSPPVVALSVTAVSHYSVVVVVLQDESCSIQTSPESWSQGSVNGKLHFSSRFSSG